MEVRVWALGCWMQLPALVVFGEAVCSLCVPVCKRRLRIGAFPCPLSAVYLGGFSDLSPLSITVKTSRGAGVRIAMCNVGIVILLLSGGSIRQMFNIWNSTPHDSDRDSNCCHPHRAQGSSTLLLTEITLCSGHSVVLRTGCSLRRV